MKRLGFALLGLVLGSLVLAGCGDSTSTQVAPATAAATPTATLAPTPTLAPTLIAPSTANLTVTGVDELNIPLRGSAYLSPNGKLIAWTDSTQLCIYSAAGQKMNCNEVKGGIYQSTIRWSPDSQRVAFSEDLFRRFVDSDIWVLDAVSGKMTDLTDDGVQGAVKMGDMGKTSTLDSAPRWSGDGKRLVFIRYLPVENVLHAAIFTIPAEGGTPTKVADLSSLNFNTYLLAWSPDGKQIAYNWEQQGNVEMPDSGIWLIGADGQNNHRVMRVLPALKPDMPLTGYSDIEFSADGHYLLGFTAVDKGLTGGDGTSNRIYTLNGGAEVEVDNAKLARYAGWFPGSSALIYLVKDEKTAGAGAGQLYVVDKPGGQGHQIYDQGVSPFNNGERGLTWAANNTVLVWSNGKVLLLHLGSK